MNRNICFSVLVSLFLVFAPSCFAQDLKPEDIYSKILPSVMTLRVESKNGSGSIGTGFMCLKEGVAVTAWHVVRDAKSCIAKFSSGEEFEVSGLIDKDEKRDVALVRIKVFGRKGLESSPEDPKIGSRSFVIGSPKGLDFSFSDGLVSQIQNIDGVKQYQFSCSASPGNSGGPLVNSKGEVIGVVSWQIRDGQNLNFAVPISYVLGLDSSLPTQPWSTVVATSISKFDDKKDSEVVRSVAKEFFDKKIAQAYMIVNDENTWSEIIDFYIFQEPGGYKSGLPSGAIALRNDSQRLAKELLEIRVEDKERDLIRLFYAEKMLRCTKHLNLFQDAITKAQENDGYTPAVRSIINEAEAVHKEKNIIEVNRGDFDVMFKSESFINTLPIDMQILAGVVKRETSFNLGVAVFSSQPTRLAYIYRDTVAFKMGFKDGDIILSFDGSPVHSLSEFAKLLRDSVGKKVKLKIVRRGENQEIERKISNIWDK